MKFPIALQLYTVRGDLSSDFEGTLKKVKEMVCDWLIEQSNEGLIEIPNHDKFIEEFNKKFNCNYKKE